MVKKLSVDIAYNASAPQKYLKTKIKMCSAINQFHYLNKIHMLDSKILEDY